MKDIKDIELAEKLLTQNNIRYKVCNVSTGQINVYIGGKCLTYYANTGKIQGYTNIRGIEAFVKLCKLGATKTEKQLFYSDLINSNNVQIFFKYYGTARDEFIISQLKGGRTQSQIAEELRISQPSLSRCINKIINKYTKFCKCIGEITADRLKGKQND